MQEETAAAPCRPGRLTRHFPTGSEQYHLGGCDVLRVTGSMIAALRADAAFCARWNVFPLLDIQTGDRVMAAET